MRGADLREADLREANLREADLGEANLSKADLKDADLNGAYLVRADFSGANLDGADFGEADLGEAILRSADLVEADLNGANLREADLRETDLRRTGLRDADLGAADLREANLAEADLRLANLIDARFDRANLSGAKLWETQRSGWSIKGVICHSAIWGKSGEEPTLYGEGEFERIFAEKVRIMLRYPGGISPADLLTLPLVVERMQEEYPDTVLRIQSMQNDVGGASVTITVEDLKSRETDVFAAEVETLRGGLLAIQRRLQCEQSLRLTIQAKYQAVVGDVLPLLLAKAIPKQEFNIGHIAAPMIVEGPTMSGDIITNFGQVGAIGPHAKAQGNKFQQVPGNTDLVKLAEELGRLREAMKGDATGTLDQDKAIGAVADAEEAAANGDGQAVLHRLKNAGKWALGIAEKIGVALATDALKRAM
ncbi:pentapeptide repeat-containing protein [Dankookia rubra]